MTHATASVTTSPAKQALQNPAQALWAAYWQDLSADARNALILHYLPLVKFAALRLSTRRGPQAEADDLMQYGIFGLKDAIASFDPARRFKFETYCSMRLRGAMLDGLKKQQWVPRDLKQKLNRFSEIHQEIEMEQGMPPADEQIAGRLGVCPSTIRSLERDSAAMSVMSLCAPCKDFPDAGGGGGERSELVEDHREESAPDSAHRADLKALFMSELTKNERQVMMLYYYEEMTMREVGATLGISGTRVSQMHTEIIHRLREKLAARVANKTGRRQFDLDV